MEEEKLRKIYQRQHELGCFMGWEEWVELAKEAYLELVERAREMPYDDMPIPYSELGAKIGLYPLSDWFPLKIGWICGACSVYEYYGERPLISALVINKETSRPGKGFGGLPGIPPHLRKVSRIEDIAPFSLDRDKERDEFWVDQVKQINRVWKRSAC